MTSFAARLVARHAAPPAVRPRARSRFEPETAWGGGAAPLPEVTGTERATALLHEDAAAVRPTADDPPATPRANPPRGARPQVRAVESGPTGAGRPSAFEPAVADRAPSTGPFLRSGDLEPAASGSRESGAGPSRPSRLPWPSPEMRPPVARRLVPSQQLVRLEPSRSAAKAEPDVVHVHIGRVDVRGANPASEPVRRPGSASPQEALRRGPLDLERYLAGERGR